VVDDGAAKNGTAFFFRLVDIPFVLLTLLLLLFGRSSVRSSANLTTTTAAEEDDDDDGCCFCGFLIVVVIDSDVDYSFATPNFLELLGLFLQLP
jgi:hypothetical protein